MQLHVLNPESDPEAQAGRAELVPRPAGESSLSGHVRKVQWKLLRLARHNVIYSPMQRTLGPTQPETGLIFV